MLLSTRNTFVSLLPGRRKFWIGLTIGLVAVLVLTIVTLEDYACARFSACIMPHEGITRIKSFDPHVATVNVATPRDTPSIEAYKEGVLFSGPDDTALLVSTVPIASEMRLRLKEAPEQDIDAAIERLANLAPNVLADIAVTHQVTLAAHPEHMKGLAGQLQAKPDLSDCKGLNAAGWRALTLAQLGVSAAGPAPMTLSLFALALECDMEAVAGVVSAGGGQ